MVRVRVRVTNSSLRNSWRYGEGGVCRREKTQWACDAIEVNEGLKQLVYQKRFNRLKETLLLKQAEWGLQTDC